MAIVEGTATVVLHRRKFGVDDKIQMIILDLQERIHRDDQLERHTEPMSLCVHTACILFRRAAKNFRAENS